MGARTIHVSVLISQSLGTIGVRGFFGFLTNLIFNINKIPPTKHPQNDGSAYHLISQSGYTGGFYLTSVEAVGNYNMVCPLVGFKFSEKRVEKAEKIL